MTENVNDMGQKNKTKQKKQQQQKKNMQVQEAHRVSNKINPKQQHQNTS
jgi:archaellum component FlaC